jgi:hypothetical protein
MPFGPLFGRLFDRPFGHDFHHFWTRLVSLLQFTPSVDGLPIRTYNPLVSLHLKIRKVHKPVKWGLAGTSLKDF